MSDHDFGEIRHDRFHLNIQVVEHLIAAPAADQLYNVAADTIIEERHITCGKEELSGDILEFKSHVWAAELEGVVEGIGDNCGTCVFPPPCRRPAMGQGGGRQVSCQLLGGGSAKLGSILDTGLGIQRPCDLSSFPLLRSSGLRR